ncbi:hypothetical protein [Halobacillus ihumii]|uniref:hypothetical protein n=1 Tax=Halobacillus ihumii TaxID=2686092 RepID=UPI0013D50265|nr:hypothetical protein [Halobacillus ihumii]
MIPTPHDIQIVKAEGLDIWGDPIAGETLNLKGFVRSKTTVNDRTEGEDVVPEYTILFIGFVDVVHADEVRFTEPNGEVKTDQPNNIKFMRNIDGKVSFTKVVV